MRYNIFSILLLVGLFFNMTSCNDKEDDSFLESGDTAVKGDKLLNYEWYSIDGKSKDYLVSIYHYDDAGNILKVEHPKGQQSEISGDFLSYEDYHYNREGKLEKIVYYNQNLSEEYINTQTETFTYSDKGLLTEKALIYPLTNQIEKTTYSYSKNLLSKESGYDNEGKLTGTTEYIYDKGNKLVSKVERGSDKTIYRTHIHEYKDGLLVHTDVYIGEKEAILREILYTYDKGNNIIKKISNELSPVSSVSGGITLYEYYD